MACFNKTLFNGTIYRRIVEWSMNDNASKVAAKQNSKNEALRKNELKGEFVAIKARQVIKNFVPIEHALRAQSSKLSFGVSEQNKKVKSCHLTYRRFFAAFLRRVFKSVYARIQ